MKKASFILLSLAIFAIFNYSIYAKEEIKAHGETVFLELVPVDPRSLMQGDYMQLRYMIERDAPTIPSNALKERGDMVIATDDKHIGRFVRFYGGEHLQPTEKRLRFHKDGNVMHIVPDSYMFQEGQAAEYQHAKYGEFKFGTDGDHILVGLADGDLRPIAPQ